MAQTKQDMTPFRFMPIGHVAVATFAVAGLSASIFAAGTAGAATTHISKGVVVSTVKNSKLGTILVSGKTLYAVKPNKVACTTQCLKIWPELVLPKGMTKATAGTGVAASKLGTVTRAGGIRQVTYMGKPLYWFSGDKTTGTVNGNITDTWGKWSVVVTAKTGSTTGSGSSSGGTNTGTGGVAF
jgi:predicted lipoprotein with Yx(FWY)xxD motif